MIVGERVGGHAIALTPLPTHAVGAGSPSALSAYAGAAYTQDACAGRLRTPLLLVRMPKLRTPWVRMPEGCVHPVSWDTAGAYAVRLRTPWMRLPRGCVHPVLAGGLVTS